jgi:hypothetical protein
MMLMLLLCDMHDREDGLCIERNKENSSVVRHNNFPLIKKRVKTTRTTRMKLNTFCGGGTRSN